MTDHQDPELYVRLLLERTLVDPAPGSSVLGALRALAGSGALDTATVAALERDVTVALALRPGPGGHRDDPGPTGPGRRRGREEQGGPDLPACRIAVGPATVALPGASLHVDAITSDGITARLDGQLVLVSAPSEAGGGQADPMADLSIVDDQGGVYRAVTRPEGGPDGFVAALVPPPPLDTAWLELRGHEDRGVRLVLTGSPTPSGPAPHHDLSPAQHYLWDLIAGRLARLGLDGSFDAERGPAPAVDALVATGMLESTDDAVIQAMLADEAAVGFGDDDRLDPRIRSVLDARGRRGRRGVWAVLAPTTVIDGVTVRVDALAASETSLRVLGAARPWPTSSLVPLTCSAGDDVGGWYAGRAGTSPGTWTLVPGLDPAAGTLIITVSGPHHAATVRLELA